MVGAQVHENMADSGLRQMSVHRARPMAWKGAMLAHTSHNASKNAKDVVYLTLGVSG